MQSSWSAACSTDLHEKKNSQVSINVVFVKPIQLYLQSWRLLKNVVYWGKSSIYKRVNICFSSLVYFPLQLNGHLLMAYRSKRAQKIFRPTFCNFRPNFFYDYIVGILASPTLSSNVNNIVSFHSDQAQIIESKILELRHI